MADGQRKRKLQVLQAEDDDQDSPCQTFVLRGEDHTLGNALRYIISKNHDVLFCGYTVPHPSEDKIHLRIQTNGIPATEALRKGFQDLQAVCEHVMGTFEASVTDYVAQDDDNEAIVE